MTVVCRGVCIRHKAQWKSGKPRYTEDSCRCTICNIWLDVKTGTKNYRCNCCNGPIKRTPKIKVLARIRN